MKDPERKHFASPGISISLSDSPFSFLETLFGIFTP